MTSERHLAGRWITQATNRAECCMLNASELLSRTVPRKENIDKPSWIIESGVLPLESNKKNNVTVRFFNGRKSKTELTNWMVINYSPWSAVCLQMYLGWLVKTSVERIPALCLAVGISGLRVRRNRFAISGGSIFKRNERSFNEQVWMLSVELGYT